MHQRQPGCTCAGSPPSRASPMLCSEDDPGTERKENAATSAQEDRSNDQSGTERRENTATSVQEDDSGSERAQNED
eukprot:4198185-Alexandrium_andersonii.AAC.1